MIDSNLLEPVKTWANENNNVFSSNGYSRRFGILQEVNPPTEVWEIKKIIVEMFNLSKAQQEPLFKDYCGYITEGGAIHQHSDPNKDGLIHTRFNVLISKPVAGGIPVQNGKEIVVEEGDVWRCDAGIVKHWCTEVVGNKPRIVLSFGFLL